jgi:hypothetical protein
MSTGDAWWWWYFINVHRLRTDAMLNGERRISGRWVMHILRTRRKRQTR